MTDCLYDLEYPESSLRRMFRDNVDWTAQIRRNITFT
jgi:hypothetical protein